MANNPHDEPAKQPDGTPKPPHTPRPGASPPTPKPAIPNMELDEVVEPIDVVEGEPIPSVTAAPDSDVVVEPVEEAPLVLSTDDVVEEVEEVSDADVFLGDDYEETPAEKAETPDPQTHAAELAEVAGPTDDAAQPATGVAPAQDAASEGVAFDADSPQWAALEATAAHEPSSDVPSFGEATTELAPTEAIEAPHVEPRDESATEVTSAEHIVDAPGSDVALADEAVEEATPASEVLLAEDAVEEATSASDIAVSEEPAEEAAALSDVVKAASVSDVVVSEEPIEAVAPPSDVLKGEEPVEKAASVSDVVVSEEPIEAVAPHSDIQVQEPLEEAAPASDVVVAEDALEEAAPVSDVVVAEDAVEEAAPVSDLVLAEDAVEEAAPISDLVEADEILEDAAPVSDVLPLGDAIEEAAPNSDVFLMEEEEEEAAPASAVVEGEEIIDEAAPLSDVLAVEEPIEEAAPASAVADDAVIEDVDEIIDEAAPLSDVIADDEIIDEVTEAVEAGSGEIIDEAVEAFEEPSSATRKAEAIFGDESEDLGETEFLDAPVGSEVLAEEPPRSGSSAVLADEVGEETVGKRPKAGKTEADDIGKTAAFDQTVAFEGKPPSSASKQGPPSSLVTEEELVGTSEASAVDLGELSSRKGGSSATGIDKVAEALESGVEADEMAETAGPEPSVLFDEAFEEEAEAIEDDDVPVKKKKAGLSDSSTDMDALAMEVEEAEAEDAEAVEFDDAEAVEFDDAEALDAEEAEAIEDEEPVVAKKKGKTVAKTGDDIDLDELFAESEGAEAVEAEDAEAVEAFDDEMEAVEAVDEDEDEKPSKKTSMAKKTAMKKKAADEDEFEVDEAEEDEKPSKKTKMAKKTAKHDEDEDDIVTGEEEEEETTSKKKSKKKERATVAPYQGPGFVMRWAGRFFLIFFGMLLIGGALAGAFFFAPPEYIKEVAEQLHKEKPPERSKRDIAREKFAEFNYTEASRSDEANIAGQAKWFAYLEKQKGKAIDKDAQEVKDAKADLKKAKNDAFLAQIDAFFNETELKNAIAKLEASEKQKNEEIASITKAKNASDKLFDDIATVLEKGSHIKDKKELNAKSFNAIIMGLDTDRTALAEVNEILDKNKIKGTGKDGLTEVFKLKKAVDDAFAEVNKVLADEKTKDMGAKGVTEIVEARNATMKDRDDVLKTLADAFKELVDGKIVVDPKADPRKDIVAGVKTARLKAESPLSIPLAQLGMSLGNIGTGTSKAVEQTFDISKVFSELGFFQTREPFIQSPQQKMTTYIALLQDRKENGAKQMAAIIREADWVLSPESKSDADAKARARYVQGLALRNQEKFDEAKTAFEETIKMMPPGPKAAEWSKLAKLSLDELTDPHAYYIPRMERFQVDGNLKAALSEADVALRAIPNNAVLNVHRGLIRFEIVRGKGAKVPEPDQKAIRDDAEIIAKDDKLVAESSYLFGLLEDELGNMNEAEKFYKKAIKQHEDVKGAPDDAGKYRVALARLLLRDRTEQPEPKKDEKKLDDEKKNEEKKKDLSSNQPADDVIVVHPWSMLIVTCVIAQDRLDEIEDKETLARYKAVTDEAMKLIGSVDPVLKGQGHMLLGQVYSKLGKRTEGLKEYAKGLGLLTQKTKLKPKEIDDLIELIDNHPAFSQPDIAATPNPVMAERHFGEGIHLYWAKQYPQAEAQFRQSVKYFATDARYQYYLGLSQLQQKTIPKRDAGIFSIEQGARLEARAAAGNPFAVREINASLERVQGELRQFLNGIRYRVQMAELDEKLKGL